MKLYKENTAQTYEHSSKGSTISGIIIDGSERIFVGDRKSNRKLMKSYLAQRIELLVELLEDLDNRENKDFITTGTIKESKNNEDSIYSRLAHPPI